MMREKTDKKTASLPQIVRLCTQYIHRFEQLTAYTLTIKTEIQLIVGYVEKQFLTFNMISQNWGGQK